MIGSIHSWSVGINNLFAYMSNLLSNQDVFHGNREIGLVSELLKNLDHTLASIKTAASSKDGGTSVS